MKEPKEKSNPLGKKRLKDLDQKNHRFLSRPANTSKSEIKSLNLKLEKLVASNLESQRLYLDQISSLKEQNSALIGQLKKLEENQANYIKEDKKSFQDFKKSIQRRLTSLEKKNKELFETVKKASQDTLERITNVNSSEVQEQVANILQNLQDAQRKLDRISASSQEAVWAHIFNSALKPEDRAKSSYSPGRWAIGYPCLYAMYRILGSMRPKNILELGLGQSTVMISDYVAKTPDVSHTVVERNPEWVEFFMNENKLPSQTRIEVLDYDFAEYGGKEGVRIFKDFEKTVGGRMYDFVCIDAPWGFDMKDYSRIDVLRSLSADFLASSFAILVDDTNRKPETNMVNAMRAVLFGRGVATAIGKYRGDKECTVICTEDLAYLTSM